MSWSLNTKRGRSRLRGGHGQTLVEFALVFPLFLLLLFAIIEFAFVFSAMLGISYATRDAALIGAEAGSSAGADCVILQAVEKDIGAPANKTRITGVVIYRADKNGNEISGVSNTWTRTGTYSTPDGSCTVPYTRTSTGYPEGAPSAVGVGGRCNYQGGCGGTRELDTIGVRIAYNHLWVTPLGGLGGNGFGGQGGTGFSLTQSNSMRMEPIL
jgi:Flp pilus assembly protein TadG